jgi:hypothetical protein
MVRTTLAILLCPPPLPVILNVNEPVDTLAGSVTVSVEAKLGVPEGELKTPLPPKGNPDTVKSTCELKPFKLTTLIENEVV